MRGTVRAQARDYTIVLACLLGIAALCPSAAADDRTPSTVVGYANLGAGLYDDPNAVLGRPTTWFKALAGGGNPGGDFACSMVAGAYNTDLNGNKIITTINTGGYITVRFDSPIEDDPANWYGRDFIVFGNSAFTTIGFVYANTNMETLKISNGPGGIWEPSTVSVSQDGVNWYDFTNGPFADDFAPTQAFTWDRDIHNWDLELDWTKPVNPNLSKASFSGKYVADAIDLYNGSAGGTAFDISGLPLPTNAQGRKWVQFIRVNGSGGEVDAVSRVSRVPDPTSIADAKLLLDGKSVRLAEGIVTAGKSELGDCFYVESPTRACGIKVTGRSVERNRRVIVGGVMTTVNGECKVKAMSIDDCGPGTLAPFGVANKSLFGGVSTTGLLVRAWGKVGSIDTVKRTFRVDDGSGGGVKCIAPPDPEFELPVGTPVVTVTGISSIELNEQSQLVPILRLRTQADLQ